MVVPQVAYEQGKLEDFKARMQFVQDTYDYGIKITESISKTGFPSATSNEALRKTVATTVKGLRKGLCPTSSSPTTTGNSG